MERAPFWQAYRLRFIDFLLDKYGTINRADLAEYFGLSIPQVSLDLRAYREQAPDNMEYDLSAKTYRRASAFKRLYETEKDHG